MLSGNAQTPPELQNPSAQEPEVALTAAQRKKAKKNKNASSEAGVSCNSGVSAGVSVEVWTTGSDLGSDSCPEAPKAEEHETTEAVSDDVTKEETPEAKKTDNELAQRLEYLATPGSQLEYLWKFEQQAQI
jgi:hypothetical protein